MYHPSLSMGLNSLGKYPYIGLGHIMMWCPASIAVAVLLSCILWLGFELFTFHEMSISKFSKIIQLLHIIN